MANIYDENITEYITQAKHGDKQAQSSLHGWLMLALADFKVTGKISEVALDELIRQHKELATLPLDFEDSDARRAAIETTVLMNAPHNRPSNLIRDESIYLRVRCLIAGRDGKETDWNKKTPSQRIFEDAAKNFRNVRVVPADATNEDIYEHIGQIEGLSAERVKKIYLAEKKKRATE